MRLSTLFTATAVVSLAYGLCLLTMPSQFLAMYDMQLNPAGVLMTRMLGGTDVGLGVMTWLARQSEDGSARRAMVRGGFAIYLFSLLVTAWGQLHHGANQLGWSTVVLMSVFTAAYGYASIAQPTQGK